MSLNPEADPEFIRPPGSNRETLDDAATWFAETIDGVMHTEFDLHDRAGELYDDDGRALGPVFANAVAHARRVAKFNPGLAFEVDRQMTERGELDDMRAMVRGEKPNTMVVTSELPHALIGETQDILGYKPRRGLGFVRVITFDGQKIKLASLSLDFSDRQGLEAIHRYFGHEPQPGELLGQRIHRQLDPQDQDGLEHTIRLVYDNELAKRRGGQWYAGRNQLPGRNTYDFVLAQRDLLDSFMQLKAANPELANKIRYDYAAAFEDRWYGRALVGSVDTSPAVFNEDQVAWEIIQAGGRAREEGRSFSGCGLTLGANGQSSPDNQLENAGYSNKKESSKSMNCVNCPKCRTFHDKLEPKGGYYSCKNKKCGHRVKA